jgi:hypothetical protein
MGLLVQPLAEFCHQRAARAFLLQCGHGLTGLIKETVFKVELNFDPAIVKIETRPFLR